MAFNSETTAPRILETECYDVGGPVDRNGGRIQRAPVLPASAEEQSYQIIELPKRVQTNRLRKREVQIDVGRHSECIVLRSTIERERPSRDGKREVAELQHDRIVAGTGQNGEVLQAIGD